MAWINGACRRSDVTAADNGRSGASAAGRATHGDGRAAGPDAIAQRVFETSVDGILAFDRHLHVTAWNPSMEGLFGLSAEEVVGRSIFAVLPCFLANGEAPRFRATLEGDAPVSHARPFSVEKSGCAGLVDCHYSPLRDEDGTTSGGLVIFRDRTRTSEVALALRDAREQFTELFEHAPIGMALIQMDAEHVGTFLRVNDALCRITGRSAAELAGSAVTGLSEEADAAPEAALARRLLSGELPRYRFEKRLQRPDGTVAWVAAGVSLLRGADGVAEHGLVQVEDITARRECPPGAPAAPPASADPPAPGLATRAAFEASLERQLADSARHGHPGAAVVLNLDGLSWIDDTLGRDAGDEAVAGVADLLRRRVRETDVVAELRRGEFGIVLRFTDPRTAGEVADELAHQVSSTPVLMRGAERHALTASAGTAPIGPRSGSASDLVARARSARRIARLRSDRAAGPGAVSPAGAV